jgi:hypothetical protein
MVIVAFIGVIVVVSLLLWIIESNSSESITNVVIDDCSIRDADHERQIDDEFDHYDDEQGPDDY